MLKTIGYILLVLCCLSFISILIIPWFGFSAKQIAGITVVLIVIGEILFYVSLIFLGKSFYAKIKNMLKFRKSKKSDLPETPDNNNDTKI
jgi:hypothetical protein